MYTTKETAFIFYIFAKYASLTRHRNAEHLTSPVQRKRTIHSTAQKLQTAGAVPSKEKFGKITVYIYRMSRGECARLRENVPYVKVHRSNPKHLYPKLNGYGDNGERKVFSSCGSTYCTCFACRYPYTAHVRPSVSQPSQVHSDFIINRCHSYSKL